MTQRQSWQRFLLVWLGGIVWIIGYMALVVWFDGTPNWLDILVWGSWVIVASRWMDQFAHKLVLLQGRMIVMAALLCCALAWSLPYVFYIPKTQGLWGVYQNQRVFLNLGPLTFQNVWQTLVYAPMALNYHFAFLRYSFATGNITTPLVIEIAILLLALGLGLTLLALIWRAIWKTLLHLIASSWIMQTYHFLSRVWIGLRRSRAWMWARRVLIALLLLILLADVVGVLFTMSPTKVEWEGVLTAGLPTGSSRTVMTLAMDPDGRGMYAGTFGGGVFRSADNGTAWIPSNYGLTDLNVLAMVVEPENNHLYVGTLGGGVFRSDDSGATWHALSDGLTDVDVRALSIGPMNTGVCAGTQSKGVFCLGDEEKWDEINQGLENLSVVTLAVNPDTAELYAGTWGGGVYKLDSNERKWHPVNDGMTASSIWALTAGPGGLYAGTWGKGIFLLEDNKTLWGAVNQGLSSLEIWALLLEPQNNNLYVGTWGGGVFKSNDRGATWHAINQGLDNLDVRALALGPEGVSLYAGTWNGIFRSDDGGGTWHSVMQGLTTLGISTLLVDPTSGGLYATTDQGLYYSSDDGATWNDFTQDTVDLDVTSLVIGPDGIGLYVSTLGGGVFRLDNNSMTWHEINHGLSDLDIEMLTVGLDGSSLLAITQERVFRWDEAEGMWYMPSEYLYYDVDGLLKGKLIDGYASPNRLHASFADGREITVSFHDPLRKIATWGSWSIAVHDGRVSLARPGTDWLPWAKYELQAPQTFAVRKNMATLYASAGAGMVLRAEIPLPVIWNLPTPYLAMIAETWRGVYWVRDNVEPLSVSLGLALVFFAAYVYVGIAHPNRLSLHTILWLVFRPRHLMAASGYQGYQHRWEIGNSLEQLALLQVTPGSAFNTKQLAINLQQTGAICEVATLDTALAALAQRGLLIQEDGAWRIGEPALAQVQRRELPPDTLNRLAAQVRQQHPLYARARSFFTQANFHVAEVGADAFRCTPQGQAHPQAGYGALYARFIAGRAPTGDDFTAVCAAARVHYGDDLAHRVAFVISDRRPEPGARYRLYEIRQREGLAIVPLDVALFGQIKPERTANDILAAEIDQATGQQNLYAISGPVSGDLSFFGRERVLQEIIDLLDAGQPVGLFGLRKMGKTSLIQRLQGRLAQRRPLALVDTQKTAQQQGIWSLYPDIIAAFAGHLQRARPDAPLPALRLWPDAPAPTPALADAFAQDVQVLHAALGAPEQGGRLLLIVDEIDRLLPAGASPGYTGFAALFGQLRALNQHAQLLDFLVVGVDAAVNRVERWTDHDNELYRAVREVWMPPMAAADVREMIESLGFQMGVRYEEDALHWLAECGGGQPFVTRQMCSRAVAERLGRGAITVTLALAQQAVEEFIYDDPYLPELWRTRLDDMQREMLRALARADGPLPRLTLLPAAQRQTALAALSALEDYTLVHREAGQYTLAWDVFRRWIRWIELGLEA